MNGFGNHRRLNGSPFIGKAKTKNKFLLLAAGIPYVSRVREDVEIEGELYEVSNETLINLLDPLEGHPRWYKRELTPIICDGKEEQAWLYFNDLDPIENERLHVVESGSYRQLIKEQPLSRHLF